MYYYNSALQCDSSLLFHTLPLPLVGLLAQLTVAGVGGDHAARGRGAGGALQGATATDGAAAAAAVVLGGGGRLRRQPRCSASLMKVAIGGEWASVAAQPSTTILA